jgi:hypothetical protein
MLVTLRTISLCEGCLRMLLAKWFAGQGGSYVVVSPTPTNRVHIAMLPSVRVDHSQSSLGLLDG